MTQAPWVVVLGASSGVGGEIARMAGRKGYHVFGLHRNNYPEAAARVQATVQESGRQCVMRIANGGSHDAAQAGAEALRETAGPQRVALCVHCLTDASVGLLVSGDKAQLHPKQLETTFSNLAHSFVYWAQALVTHDLMAPGSLFLGMTNPFTEQLVNGFCAISAAKAALTIYVRHLALELAPRKIRCNLLRFGLVETEAIKRVIAPDDWATVVKTSSRLALARRLQSAEEVAGFVFLLLAQEASYLNGATIDLTGGQAGALLDPVINFRHYAERP